MSTSEVISSSSEPSEKNVKLDTSNNGTINKSIHDEKFDFANFQITKILSNNTMRKLVIVQGTFKDQAEPAIVILEKKCFPEEKCLQTSICNENTDIEKVFVNDIYGNYEYFPAKDISAINATIVHPATQKHIDKYTMKPKYIVDETYELYKNVTLPYIDEQQFSLKWVDNIINHEAESERIIYEDSDDESGFIMLPDLKWDGDIQTLHVCILARKKIKSLRELNGSHLPLLKKIKEKGSEVMKEKYNILPSQLRMYLHYQPSYYHLHVHCSTLMQELTMGVSTERAHMLINVISNLEIDSNYYQKCTLPFLVFKDQPLYKKYQELNMLPSDEEGFPANQEEKKHSTSNEEEEKHSPSNEEEKITKE